MNATPAKEQAAENIAHQLCMGAPDFVFKVAKKAALQAMDETTQRAIRTCRTVAEIHGEEKGDHWELRNFALSLAAVDRETAAATLAKVFEADIHFAGEAL